MRRGGEANRARSAVPLAGSVGAVVVAALAAAPGVALAQSEYTARVSGSCLDSVPTYTLIVENSGTVDFFAPVELYTIAEGATEGEYFDDTEITAPPGGEGEVTFDPVTAAHATARIRVYTEGADDIREDIDVPNACDEDPTTTTTTTVTTTTVTTTTTTVTATTSATATTTDPTTTWTGFPTTTTTAEFPTTTIAPVTSTGTTSPPTGGLAATGAAVTVLSGIAALLLFNGGALLHLTRRREPDAGDS